MIVREHASCLYGVTPQGKLLTWFSHDLESCKRCRETELKGQFHARRSIPLCYLCVSLCLHGLPITTESNGGASCLCHRVEERKWSDQTFSPRFWVKTHALLSWGWPFSPFRSPSRCASVSVSKSLVFIRTPDLWHLRVWKCPPSDRKGMADSRFSSPLLPCNRLPFA